MQNWPQNRAPRPQKPPGAKIFEIGVKIGVKNAFLAKKSQNFWKKLIFWPPKNFFKKFIFIPSCRAHSALQNIQKLSNLNDRKKSYSQKTAKNAIFGLKMGGIWQKINFLGVIGVENQKSENEVLLLMAPSNE